MIDERMEEQASLHVLGALAPEEALEFKKKMQSDPELQAFVASLSPATGAVAGAIPLVEPPPQLRAKILAQAGGPQKIISLPPQKLGWRNWLPWALATGLAAVCMMLFAQDSQLKQEVNAQAEKINSLNVLASSLTAATNDLQQTVAALKETNRLANLKIAMLNSLLADSPTAIAVTLWDESKQEGVFVAQHLKALPPGRDYQLWVMENGTTPVDAGVFHVDASGGGRVEFKTKQPIKIAGKFAVTEESLGGVTSPTLKNMVLAGG